MSSFTYSRRPATHSLGQDYEHRMTALFSLRCALSGKFKEFWIASNVNDVGDFDDVVLSVVSNTDKRIAFLIQLKHIVSTTKVLNLDSFTCSKEEIAKKRKNSSYFKEYGASKEKMCRSYSCEGFSIDKYWKTFDELQSKLTKNEEKDDTAIIKELRQAEEIVFVLYTNIGVDSRFDNGNYLKKPEEDDNFYDLLNTTDMKHCHEFNHEHKQLKKYDYKFLKKLRLFENQLHAEEVIDLMKTYIETLLNLKFPAMVDLNDVINQYVQYIKSWLLNGYKIGEQNMYSYYTLTKSDVLQLLVGILLDTYKYDFSKKDYTSYSYAPKTIWNQIIKDKAVTVLKKNDRVIAFIQSYYGNEVRKFIQEPPKKVWSESLPKNAEKDLCAEFGHAKVAQVCQNSELSMALIYKTLWMYGRAPLLLHLDESNHFEDILKILKVCQDPIKVVVLVPDISNLALSKNSLYFVTFDDLPPKHQEIILEVEVNFQGRLTLPLMNCVDESMHTIIKCQDIIDILCNQCIIGAKIGEIYQYFIGRCVSRVLLSYEVLGIANEAFLIEAPNRQAARERLTKFIAKNSRIDFLNSEEGRRELKSTERTQHRLKYKDGYLEWVESVGNTSNLRNYQVESHHDEYELLQPENLCRYLTSNRANRTRVISGSPGMGKSTLLDFVAYSAPSGIWVLKIKLTEMVVSKATTNKTDSLSKADSKPGCSRSSDYSCSDYESSPDDDHLLSRTFDITKYLESVATEDETISTSDLSLAVFKKLYRDNKILILLDGFDEIPNLYKEKVTEIIVHLKNQQHQVWITTRDHLKRHLENKLGVLASTLKPFTHDEQRSYLITYFKANIETSDETIVEKFADRLLIAAKKNLSDRDGQFTGIPLQTLLLAECFLKQCQMSCKDNEIKLIEHFDLLDLYELFMKKKKRILVEEKYGSNELVVSEASNVDEAQQCFALHIVLGEDIVRKCNMKKKLDLYNEDIENGILQRGGILVVRESKNGIHVDFIHRTFAEYFVAQFLSKSFSSNDSVRRNVLSMIEKRFLSSEEHEFIFRVFDSLRARELSFDLHKFIINAKIDKIEHEMQKNPKGFLKQDELNRSGLHMLVLYGRGIVIGEESLMDLLPFELVGLNRFDRYLTSFEVSELKLTDCFGYNILDYCLYFGNWKFASALCRKSFTMPFTCNRYVFSDLQRLWRSKYSMPWLLHPDIFRTIVHNYMIRDLLFGRSYENKSISDYCAEKGIHNHYLKGIIEPGVVMVSDYLAKIGIKDSKNSKYLDIRFAVALGNKTNVEDLLASREIDVNERDGNTGNTLLHYASYNKRAEIFDLLIEHGADINRTGQKRRTVLHTLARIGQVNLLKNYWDRIKNVDVEDFKGFTPLDYALQYNQTEAVITLIEKGAKLKAAVVDAVR